MSEVRTSGKYFLEGAWGKSMDTGEPLAVMLIHENSITGPVVMELPFTIGELEEFSGQIISAVATLKRVMRYNRHVNL